MPPLTASGLRLEELFQQAPGFMAVLTGPAHVFTLANPAYLRLIGFRDIVGRPVAEALPEAASQGYVDLLDQVYRTGEAYSAARALYSVQAEPGGTFEDRYVDFVFQPIRGEDGKVAQIFVQGVDVTDQVRASRFTSALVRLNDAIRDAQPVAELSYAAGQVLGEALDVSRAAYGTIDLATEVLTVERDWRRPGSTACKG